MNGRGVEKRRKRDLFQIRLDLDSSHGLWDVADVSVGDEVRTSIYKAAVQPVLIVMRLTRALPALRVYGQMTTSYSCSPELWT